MLGKSGKFITKNNDINVGLLYINQIRCYNKSRFKMRAVKRKFIKKKQINVQFGSQNNVWCFWSLNMKFDKKFYLPYMNDLRKQGYWLPNWLDVHPKRITQECPNEYKSNENILNEWNNEEDFNSTNYFILNERSRPHKAKPGVPHVYVPPKILRMEPPKPNDNDLQHINDLSQNIDKRRLYTLRNKNQYKSLKVLLRQ